MAGEGRHAVKRRPVAYRLRHRQANAGAGAPVLPRARSWPSQARPAPRRPAIERAAEVHLHFHGISAEEAAAIVRRAIGDGSA